MSLCGLWQGSQRTPITAPATPEHTHHLLDYLVSAGIDTLILAEHSPLIALAQARNLHLRLVPHALLEGIRNATALNHRAPRFTASLLARWPFSPALRLHLREVRPTPPRKNQLALF